MGEEKIRILVVDDELGVQRTVSGILEDEGYEVTATGKGQDAIDEAKKKFYNVVITDIKLPDISGLEVLKAVREINEDTMVIMETAFASLETSIEAMNKGAYTYVPKPFNMDELLVIIKKCLERQRLSIENKRLLQELRRANEEMQRLTQIKSAFTSMVSHELRTPLAALKEGVSLVSEGIVGTVNPEQKRFLDIAKSNVDRLARLINEVLDFQTLTSGKVPFKMESNDINEVVKEIRESMLPLAEKKNLDLTLNLDENLSLVRFDRDKINQVLTNLVGNSIKLTVRGGIIISTGIGDNIVQVSVQDTGPGIKEEDMPRLFQQYEQLERKVGGTGLGLAISLEIIKAHGGKIWAESKFGQGTTLYFVLPIKERRIA